MTTTSTIATNNNSDKPTTTNCTTLPRLQQLSFASRKWPEKRDESISTKEYIVGN